ncbi:hypothetical protein CEP54_006508 [Fusarium duplospermum]|uniref:Uncharacterized protein n=1 Tax=Fusarium duplospermum TaxID=1325734 RepID=A0A428Q6L7_9HYPO|nr:hypothetical protein CEP54_006508 [Fusarium duplospermum]
MASPQYHNPNRGRHSPEDWTPEMRDRQARGKEPEKEEESASVRSADTSNSEVGYRHYEETQWEKERRGEALSVLDNPEALLAHAQANGDSVTGQRARFLRLLCGYDEDRDRYPTQQMRSSKGHQHAGDRGGR